jgi:hypothetical protein
MKVFGYPNRTVNPHGLVELREVTFVGTPTMLRGIAGFLLAAAEQMEEKATGSFNHLHMCSYSDVWQDTWPGVIAAEPTK